MVKNKGSDIDLMGSSSVLVETLRKRSNGSRTYVGSRVVALLCSPASSIPVASAASPRGLIWNGPSPRPARRPPSGRLTSVGALNDYLFCIDWTSKNEK